MVIYTLTKCDNMIFIFQVRISIAGKAQWVSSVHRVVHNGTELSELLIILFRWWIMYLGKKRILRKIKYSQSIECFHVHSEIFFFFFSRHVRKNILTHSTRRRVYAFFFHDKFDTTEWITNSLCYTESQCSSFVIFVEKPHPLKNRSDLDGIRI